MDSNLPSDSKAEYTSDAIRPANNLHAFPFRGYQDLWKREVFQYGGICLYDAEIIVNDPENNKSQDEKYQ